MKIGSHSRRFQLSFFSLNPFLKSSFFVSLYTYMHLYKQLYIIKHPSSPNLIFSLLGTFISHIDKSLDPFCKRSRRDSFFFQASLHPSCGKLE